MRVMVERLHSRPDLLSLLNLSPATTAVSSLNQVSPQSKGPKVYVPVELPPTPDESKVKLRDSQPQQPPPQLPQGARVHSHPAPRSCEEEQQHQAPPTPVLEERKGRQSKASLFPSSPSQLENIRPLPTPTNTKQIANVPSSRSPTPQSSKPFLAPNHPRRNSHQPPAANQRNKPSPQPTRSSRTSISHVPPPASSSIPTSQDFTASQAGSPSPRSSHTSLLALTSKYVSGSGSSWDSSGVRSTSGSNFSPSGDSTRPLQRHPPPTPAALNRCRSKPVVTGHRTKGSKPSLTKSTSDLTHLVATASIPALPALVRSKSTSGDRSSKLFSDQVFGFKTPEKPKEGANEQEDISLQSSAVLDDVDLVSPKSKPTLKSKQEERKKRLPTSSPLPQPTILSTQSQSQTPTKPSKEHVVRRGRRISSVTSMASHAHTHPHSPHANNMRELRDSHTGRRKREVRIQTPPRSQEKTPEKDRPLSHTEQLEQVLYSRWLEGLRKRWEVEA